MSSSDNYHQDFAKENGHRQMLDNNFLFQSTLTPFVVMKHSCLLLSWCVFLFDDKSTLVFVGDTLGGMESTTSQRAHTRV